MKHLKSEFISSASYLMMTEDQKGFIHEFFNGKNIGLLANAGTGKSFCVKALHQFLITKGVSVGLTALTGIAAIQIGGSTLHSWLGCALADEDIKSIFQTVARNKKAVDRIKFSKVLIIDEISMASGDFLNKVDLILKYFRLNNDPFGGLQMVFVGDFLQLPPVFKKVDDQNDFCFKSRAWKDADIKVINFKKIMRQTSDSDFIEMLNLVRVGDTSKLHILSKQIDYKFPNDGIPPVQIFCKNIDVDRFNKEKLNKISGDSKFYYAIDSGAPHHIDFFNRNCPSVKLIELKIGASVMLLQNLDITNGLVNGSVGVVESFMKDGPLVRFINGQKAIIEPHVWEIKEQVVGINKTINYKIVATRIQLPLKLAFSQNVHRSQGTTLDRAVLDISEAFAAGMVYVALSRVRALNCLSIKDFSPSKIIVNQECLDFYKDLE